MSHERLLTHGIVYVYHARALVRPLRQQRSIEMRRDRHDKKRDQPIVYRVLGFVGLVEGEVHVQIIREDPAVYHLKLLAQRGTRKTAAVSSACWRKHVYPWCVGQSLLRPRACCCTAVVLMYCCCCCAGVAEREMLRPRDAPETKLPEFGPPECTAILCYWCQLRTWYEGQKK